MAGTLDRATGLTKTLTIFVVLALLAAVLLVFVARDGKKYVTAEFAQTNSLYKGSTVKILGVPVGAVESLETKGDHVEVKLSYKGDITLPADVKAVIISPSIIGDRFVQLAPAYSGGAKLPDDANLGLDRTEVPVELDDVYASFDSLAKALGPEGANKDGSLSTLINNLSDQFEGQGPKFNETLKNFGDLSDTLAANKDNLFGSIKEVNTFVDVLQRNDSSVRTFFDSTAAVSQTLEAERDDLAKTLKNLSAALIDVRAILKENRGAIRSNVDNLQVIADVLGQHQKDIEGILRGAPVALGNVSLAYNGRGDAGTLDIRANLLDIIGGADPVGTLTSLISGLGFNLGDLGLGGLALPDLPLPRPAAANSTTDPGQPSVADMLVVN